MIDINLTKQRNTAQKSVHYMPTMKLRDNLRIGNSYNYDNSTAAKGTLYPYNMNNVSGIGSVSTMYSNEYSGYSDFDLDNESFTNNEVKYKTAEAYFQQYKKFKGVDINFIQQQFGLTSSTILNSGRMALKMFSHASGYFTMVYVNTGGTAGVYAVAGSINATTGALTFGTPVSLDTATPSDISYWDVCEIDTGKYVAVFQKTVTTMRNVCFTAATTVITAGTAVDVTITDTSALDTCTITCAKASTTSFGVVFSDSTAGGVCRAYHATVSGTTITAGTSNNIFGASSQRYEPRLAFTSSSAGMWICRDNSNNLRTQPFTVSGTTITIQTETQQTTGSADQWSKNARGMIFVALSNGWYYYFNTNSSCRNYYFSVSSGVASIVDYKIGGIMSDSTYGESTDWVQHSANEWSYITRNNSSINYLVTFSFDTTTQRMNVVLREMPYNYTSLSFSRLAYVKSGTQYVLLASTSSNQSNLYSATFQEGAAQLFFEGEGTQFATATNAKWGWAYAKYVVSKTIGRTVGYLSVKNTTGNTVIIKTTNWYFEVE